MPHIYPARRLPDIRRTFCFCPPGYSHQIYTRFGSVITQNNIELYGVFFWGFELRDKK